MEINFMNKYVCLAALCVFFHATTIKADELAIGFANPPDSAKPHTFWHWMNGNISKDGITADLEAMKEIGIGGVALFQIEGKLVESMPVYIDKPIRALTPEWFAMLRHTAAECKRLGLEFSIMNCTGWSTSGGPWVKPENSMMRIAWSEKYIKGPGRIAQQLPKPPCDYTLYQNLTSERTRSMHESVPPEQRFYQDVAILAYRLDPTAVRVASFWPPKLTCSETDGNPILAVDGDGSTKQKLPVNGFIQFDFGEPAIVRGVEYMGNKCELQASDDRITWRKIADVPLSAKQDSGHLRYDNYPKTMPIPETKARYFRLFYSKGGSVVDVKLSGDSLVQDYQAKSSFHCFWEHVEKAEDRIGLPSPNWAKETIEAKDVINLTDRLNVDGTLDWDVPEGDWMIVRIGCAPTGMLNGPSAREFAGLECNKLDASAVELHFNEYAGRIATELKDLVGSGFHAIHVDSWEAGDLNFTPNFIQEFRKRRGYDPTPYLLVHAGGRIVDSPAISDRFLWDVRRTIADLLADNYFSKLNELCHKRGLKFQGEIAGAMVPATVDQLQIKGLCDVPMGEFQTCNCVYGDLFARWDAREAASGAHVHGKRIVGAEAFTCFDQWTTDLFGLKGIGDLAFAMGINRFLFHTYAHDSWPTNERVPGMTMGPFGVNISRKSTWWGRPAKAWIDYLRRCQFMLRQGLYVADILYFYGEGAPNSLPPKNLIDPALPDGYSYDGCDAKTLLTRVQVKDGRLTLPNGMKYRVLVLKNDTHMTPRLLKKIEELVNAGAIVIGPKPLASPSLTNYPKCDQEVKSIADELWGNIDGEKVTENAHGKGCVAWGPSVGDILRKLGVKPDLEFRQIDGVKTVEWIHRRSGDADIYFISNQENISQHGLSHDGLQISYTGAESLDARRDTAELEAAFRVVGRQPQLWNAVTGTIRDLPEFREENGQTIVPITLAPVESCFVVFRKSTDKNTPQYNRMNFPTLKTAATIEGQWKVTFDPKWGGPGQVTFENLDDWTKRSEPGIKYYSGRAIYHKSFDAPQSVCEPGRRVYLDLGVLHSLAEVRLNGKDLGVLWCSPWIVDVSGILKPVRNNLEISIINVWANRIIGDASLPEEQRITWTSQNDTIKALKPNHKLIPSGLRGPVSIKME